MILYAVIPIWAFEVSSSMSEYLQVMKKDVESILIFHKLVLKQEHFIHDPIDLFWL